MNQQNLLGLNFCKKNQAVVNSLHKKKRKKFILIIVLTSFPVGVDQMKHFEANHVNHLTLYN